MAQRKMGGSGSEAIRRSSFATFVCHVRYVVGLGRGTRAWDWVTAAFAAYHNREGSGQADRVGRGSPICRGIPQSDCGVNHVSAKYRSRGTCILSCHTRYTTIMTCHARAQSRNVEVYHNHDLSRSGAKSQCRGIPQSCRGQSGAMSRYTTK
jgi:hypothetical protein